MGMLICLTVFLVNNEAVFVITSRIKPEILRHVMHLFFKRSSSS